MEMPRLIEPNARYFLYNTLQKCHDHRVQIYTMVLNVGIFLLFVLIVGSILYYCYKKKLTPYEQQQKMLRDQQYILSKIRYYQSENMNKQTSEITNLPIAKFEHF
jgi:Na+-transporting NADH:ubiquinone oxidoreductase subunit NqrC